MSEATGFAWVCLGAAVGAPGRYLVDRFVQARHDSVMPWGTLCVNVVGCFALGLLVGVAARHDVPDAVTWALGAGLCGALTTYSTFSYETLRLYEEGARLYGVVNVALSVAGGMAAALGGFGVAAIVG